MEGLGFDLTILIWIGACILFNIIVWCVTRSTLKNITIKNSNNETVGKNLENQDKIAAIIRPINIAVWIIIIAVMVIFHGTKRYVPHSDMGAKSTILETKKLETPTNSEIETLNSESLREKEVLIEREVGEDQKESADDYQRFIEESLKNHKD